MRSLRIAITADPGIPVPPRHYGGIERIVHLLVCGLSERAHQITLFADKTSQSPGQLVAYPASTGNSTGDFIRNAARITREIQKGHFDLIHSFGRLGYLTTLLPLRIPKLMSYQRPITPRSIVWSTRMARGSLHFTACSRQMTAPVRDLAPWHVVYNGVAPERYRFQPAVAADAPLVFLGRVEHIKGAHLAVEVAKRTGRRLIVAGNIPQGEEHAAYFESEIKPYVDGQQISYVGPVDDEQKDALLGGAAALLMPILWDEPFGIVMAEALACGTPVIGLRRGSVPELVQHGVNGFVCDDLDALAGAVGRVGEIDRRNCRRVMEDSFSGPAMVDSYLSVYQSMLARYNASQLSTVA
jgi:glycosyltransferase involved in cell wall biosynthesis